MKKSASLIVIFLLTALNVNADQWVTGNICYTYVKNSGVATAAFASDALRGDVVIPETVTLNGAEYTVTAIADQAFSRYSVAQGMTSLTLPESITSIGARAFNGCNIPSVTIPANVEAIGAEAFSGCKKLSHISFAEGSKLTAIPDKAFYDCTALTEFPTLPPSVTSIGACAFQLTGLVSVTIPETVTELGSTCFGNISSLKTMVLHDGITAIPDNFVQYSEQLSYITFPTNLKSIGKEAFRQCRGIASLKLPDTVETIGSSAFLWCTGMQSLTLPKSLKVVEQAAFAHLGVRELYLPDNIEEVKESGFAYNYSLRTLRLSENLTKIGDKAFCDADFLKELRLPPSVQEIGSKAFSFVNAKEENLDLEKIMLWHENPPVIADDTFPNFSIEVEVLDGTLDRYQTADVWSNFTNIHEGLTSGVSTPTSGGFSPGTIVEVHTLTGALAYRGPYAAMQLPRGLYIVHAGNRVIKMRR